MNNRQAALKAAVDFYGKGENSEQVGGVLAISDQFLAWLQGGSTGGVAHPSPVTTQATENPQSATTVNPSRPWERITKQQADRDEDAELHSMMEQMPPDEPGYDYGP